MDNDILGIKEETLEECVVTDDLPQDLTSVSDVEVHTEQLHNHEQQPAVLVLPAHGVSALTPAPSPQR